MNMEQFGQWANKASEWGVNYRKSIRKMPVRSMVKPGDITKQLAVSAPEEGQPMEDIFEDFENIIMPGMTHWQHPRFFAYFPSNAAPASVIAEFLATSVAAQCMLWQTSPAATELETRVIDWLRQAMDLPKDFSGVIQDTASSATLAAILTMRERALNWNGNTQGLANNPATRVYASNQVHTSIDRAIWIAGIGDNNLVRIPIQGELRGMDCAALESAIIADKEAGLIPAGIVACVGGTSIGGTDDIAAVCAVAKRHNLYVHVDAAWAGSAMICPEYRHFWTGIENANSIVFNPHKWMGTHVECSVHFVKEPEDLVRTLAIKPEYLKTRGHDGIINYSEWTIQLGRRFRALKLWFLLRSTGLEKLRDMFRLHVNLAEDICEKLRAENDFKIISDPMLSLFSFRFEPKGQDNIEVLNMQLVEAINDDGRIYLTQTRVDGEFAIRLVVGQFETTKEDVDQAFDVICEIARNL